jgi:hypothetical protein
LLAADGTHQRFEVGPDTSERLAHSRDRATAMLYRSDVVAVITSDGQTQRTLEGGARAAAFAGTWALIAVVGAPLLGQYAVRKRREWGGWWRREGPTVTPIPERPSAFVASVAVFFAIMAGCAMLFGAPWRFAVGVGALLAVAFVFAYLTRGRRRSG